MKTLKISDEDFLELQHIATVLRLRGLGGAPLLENITAQKRYSLVLSRTVTQTAEVTFAAQDDADAEAKIEAFKTAAEQLNWELYDVPGKPKTVMVSEIMTRHTPDQKPEHDDPPAPDFWPKLRETWEEVDTLRAQSQEKRGTVIGVGLNQHDELHVTLITPGGRTFDWTDLPWLFNPSHEAREYYARYYRKVSDAP